MVTLAQLWIPILLSAALVFLASGLIWMVIGWHNKDFAKIPNEDAVAAALQGAPRGTYMLPYARGAEMRCEQRGDRVVISGHCAWYLKGEIEV